MDIWDSFGENRIFAYAKTKPQISCAVTAQLISAFVFPIWIVQFLFFLNPKFQASSDLLSLHSPVCVGTGRNPEDRFSHNKAHICMITTHSVNRMFSYIVCSFTRSFRNIPVKYHSVSYDLFYV